jgi:hypothetical protein
MLMINEEYRYGKIYHYLKYKSTNKKNLPTNQFDPQNTSGLYTVL